tara:strand:+ start:787 stop:1395 length:609 start_codon:yes stop_codon:yes gene_type:complete
MYLKSQLNEWVKKVEETLNNFFITGYGRSGTTFLAKMMNKSKQWTVNHEARGYADTSINNIVNIKQAFKTPFYGEVNNYLRNYIHDIEVDKIGVITRDTQDIFLSMANRKEIGELKWRINGVHEMYTKILPNIPANTYIIEFEKMTNDKEYLKQIFFDFGITDIDMEEINLEKKVNSSTGKWYNTWDELPEEHKELYFSKEW